MEKLVQDLNAVYGTPIIGSVKQVYDRHLVLMVNSNLPKGKLYVNKLVSAQLLSLFSSQSALKLWKSEVKTIECYCVRYKANRNKTLPSEFSTHSWAWSLDINHKDNPMGVTDGKSKFKYWLTDSFVKMMAEYGFLNLSYDRMHFQLYDKYLKEVSK